MASLKTLLAVAVAVAPIAAVVPPPFIQLYVDAGCDSSEYILYDNVLQNGQCITIGGPGFPFSAGGTSDPTCGDYTDYGNSYGPCGNGPRNAFAVRGGGAEMRCSFWSNQDCSDDVSVYLNVHPTGGTCGQFPFQGPLNGPENKASSFSCLPA